ncbi:hypothetical protein ACIQVT_00265 [Streptomyces sp. NPDC100445]|uniref:hypothetical protein n=1 Tax=Streptomyces sp. NPDC100445 TaxID=3366102 RepID=UPI003808112F
MAILSKDYRCATNHQVVLDTDPRLAAIAIGKPQQGNRNHCRRHPMVIADSGYRGTGLVIPRHRRHKQVLR